MFLSKYKLPLLVVFLVLLVAASYLLLTQNVFKVQPPVSVSPSEAPLTSQTVDEQLGQTDVLLNGALNQMDIDTSNLNQIDASQDSITF